MSISKKNAKLALLLSTLVCSNLLYADRNPVVIEICKINFEGIKECKEMVCFDSESLGQSVCLNIGTCETTFGSADVCGLP